MNVSEPFIRRPVGTTLLMAAIMLSGMVAYTFLPLSTQLVFTSRLIKVSYSAQLA